MKDLRRLQALYDLMREIPPENQHSFLDLACEGNEDLKVALRNLLAINTDAPNFLDTPIHASPTPIGKSLGDYTILKELGSGGMGRVFLAEEGAPVHRQVAIKFVAYWGASTELRQRFDVEQQNLARMNHPYIAKLFASGLSDEGQPYFVMEYLDGEPITTYCDRHNLSVSSRIELFLQVCEGVSHAHLKGIIHRDLKPGNILIVEERGGPVPKIIDFGIAKNLDQTALTHTGQRPGSYCYMSPEQAGALDEEGKPRDQDFRSDVYALATLFYEILVGNPPLSWPPGTPATKIFTDICEKPPNKPSQAWAGLAEQDRAHRADARSSDAETMKDVLDGDLDWILMKAMEKDPNRRYRSTDHLIQEIRRYQHHEPVDAGPPTYAYVLSKLIRRHRRVVVTMVAALMMVLGFAGVIAMQNSTIAQERDHARNEALTAEEVTDFLVSILTAGDPYSHDNPVGITETKVQDVVDQAREQIQSSLDEQPKTKALICKKLGDVYLNWGQRKKALRMFAQALEIMSNQEESEAEVAMLTGMMGESHARMGNFKEAVPLLRRAIALNKSLYGAEGEPVIAHLNHLANVYIIENDWDQALSLAQESLTISVKHHGPIHNKVGWAHNNLGRIHRNLWNFPRAIHHFEEALNVLTQLEGEHHPQRADVLNNLAMVYLSDGQFTEAESLLHQALEIDIAIHGYEHFLVSIGLLGLGDVYRKMGNPDLAELHYRESLHLKYNQGDDNHPGTGRLLYHLANIVQDESPVEAYYLFLEALRIAEYSFSKQHYQRAEALLGLANTLNIMDSPAQALPFIEESKIIFSQNKQDHPYPYFSATHALAESHIALACFEEAEELLLEIHQAIKADERSVSEGFPARVCVTTIELYEAWDKPKKAEEYRNRLAQYSQPDQGPP